jgi:beta-glucosidase
MSSFPNDFLWGAATSSHQVEGNNSNNDWWIWEKTAGLADLSGQACRHYELYRQDFDLAKSLNHNAHRFSLEWSRIEPSPGNFNEKELIHYRDVLQALRERGLEPVVTLHHFTNPIWFSKMGGWHSSQAVHHFLQFSAKVVNFLGEQVKYWVTINEPMVYVYNGYLVGVWPPQRRSIWLAHTATRIFADAHIQAYKLIHSIYQTKGWQNPLVSVAHNMRAFQPLTRSLRNRISIYLRNKFFNLDFLDRIAKANAMDYIGVNYYTRDLVDACSWTPGELLQGLCRNDPAPLEKNYMGWDIAPEGFYDVLLLLKKYRLPIIITENGTCVGDDKTRWLYIYNHLKNLLRAKEAGLDIRGYLYWSLLDNFEWDKGFAPKFGLIEVDYKTYKRTVRQSAMKYAQICRTGQLGSP